MKRELNKVYCLLYAVLAILALGGCMAEPPEKAAREFLTAYYTSDTARYRDCKEKMEKELESAAANGEEQFFKAFEEYDNIFRPLTTEACLEKIFANRLMLKTDELAAELGADVEPEKIELSNRQGEDTVQAYTYEVTFSEKSNLPKETGRISVESGKVSYFEPDKAN